jgi:dolichol-phosphate mannosyltransferase
MRQPCREALLLFNGMHRFIPALIRSMDFRVTEVPVNHRPRIHGVSKYGFGNRALRATTDMLGIRWLNSRRARYQIRDNA